VSQQRSSGPSTELVAIVMFFAGFALGVQAERTQVPPQPAAVARAIAAAPASALPHAMRGMTGLMQLGGAVTP
jgi:hypothetical protein